MTTSRRKVRRLRVSSSLLLSTVVSSLGGFLFGYDNIVISGAIGYLSVGFHITPIAVGWAAGCALIGCLVGSLFSGPLADRFGLKKALYACAFCFALSSLGVFTADTFGQFVGWRILGGIGIGAASIAAPMYIAEVAPASVRGRLVVFYQLGIVTGILCAVFVNMLIERGGTENWNVEHGWRWMFAVAAVPAVLFGFTILFCRESARWLIKTGQTKQALEVMSTISGSETAHTEVTVIQQSLAEEQGGLGELVTGSFRNALAVGILLAAFSQASGITSLLSFLPELFRSAGRVSNEAFSQAVLVGAVNLAFTVLAIWLVDRAGRKTLLLLGTGLQTFSLTMVGLLYLGTTSGGGVLFGIMLFVGGHAIGNGAVCWVIISEIFPTKVRGLAMSIATTALWATAYLANQFFPLMKQTLGNHGTFFFFAGMAALNLLFVLKYVPETRGYSLEAISRIWLKAQSFDNALSVSKATADSPRKQDRAD